MSSKGVIFMLHYDYVLYLLFAITLLTLILLTWRIWWAPKASKWQMGLNLAFKGL